MSEQLQTLTCGTPGREVHYYRAGRGAPVLYLHHVQGLLGFEPGVAQLADNFDVIAPFAPGFGPARDQLSDVDEGPLDLTLHFADFLDALALDSVHVVGASIGAWMGAELAAIYAQRVRSLVLSNPLGLWLEDAPGIDPFAQHPGFPSKVLFSDPDMRKQFVVGDRDLEDAHVNELLNLRAAAKFMWPIPDTGVRRRLPRITCPTLVITCAKDTVVPSAHGPAWAELITNSTTAEIEESGHLPTLEQPDAFAARVSSFIKQCIEDKAA